MPHSSRNRKSTVSSVLAFAAWLSEAPIERILFFGLLAVLVWAPIPLGSNRPWAWALLQGASFGLVALWLGFWAVGKVELPNHFGRTWPLLVGLAIWLAWLTFQILPLPIGVIETLSPEAARLHGLVRAYSPNPDWATLSVELHASKAALLRSLGYACIAFLILVLVNQRGRVKTLARVLVISGLALSIFGLASFYLAPGFSWFGSLMDPGSVSATYPNRNHFAGWLEMTLALGIGLLIAELRDRRYETWRQFWIAMIDLLFSEKVRVRIYLCIMVIALVTTHSRMGNTAFFASLLVAGSLGLLMGRYAPRGTALLLASLLAIDLFIVGSWFGVEKLAQRIEQTTVAEYQERQTPSDIMFNQINDYGLIGSGGGSFYTVFSKYRTEKVAGYFDYAHNDYAQVAAEYGWIGLGIAALIVALALATALWAQWVRRDPLMRGMAFASIMGITALLIHSWVDFNLQIPANAQLFTVLITLPWIALHLDRRPREPAAITQDGPPEGGAK